jgi:small subunit ribosomal protein S6
MTRKYETTYIINAALEDAEIEQIHDKISTYLKDNGAEILETNKWGRKRLAYPINKKFNGFYTHLIFTADPAKIPDFERFLVLDESIMRHLTLQLSDQMIQYRKEREIKKAEAEAAREEEEKEFN